MISQKETYPELLLVIDDTDGTTGERQRVLKSVVSAQCSEIEQTGFISSDQLCVLNRLNKATANLKNSTLFTMN